MPRLWGPSSGCGHAITTPYFAYFLRVPLILLSTAQTYALARASVIRPTLPHTSCLHTNLLYSDLFSAFTPWNLFKPVGASLKRQSGVFNISLTCGCRAGSGSTWAESSSTSKAAAFNTFDPETLLPITSEYASCADSGAAVVTHLTSWRSTLPAIDCNILR